MKKYKTEICKNFEMKGYCKWGDKCCFAHGQHELRAKQHLNTSYKSKICKHYHRIGTCPYGLRCQYFHIKDTFTYDEFLNAFAEKVDLKCKESIAENGRNDTVDSIELLKSITKLTPSLDVFTKLLNKENETNKKNKTQNKNNNSKNQDKIAI